MGTNRGCLFRACYSKSQPSWLLSGRESKASREVGKLSGGKSSLYTVTGGFWHSEAGGERSRNETFDLIGSEAYLIFSGWYWIGNRSKKNTEAGNHCPSLDRSGAIAAEFVGQSRIVIYGLAIFCSYSPSLEHEKESVCSQAFLFIIWRNWGPLSSTLTIDYSRSIQQF